MTRTQISLKSLDDGRESLDIDLEIDHEARRATLLMLEYDPTLVTSFVTRTLPEYGVRVGGADGYAIVISLAGRAFPAKLQRLADGRVEIRLGDPDAAYLARCEKAMAKLFEGLAALDIEAVVPDVDRLGRPDVDDGEFLTFLVSEANRGRDDVYALVAEVCTEFDVNICPHAFALEHGYVEAVVRREAHFAWDPFTRKVVTRNWSPA
jgi:hypothetical protein